MSCDQLDVLCSFISLIPRRFRPLEKRLQAWFAQLHPQFRPQAISFQGHLGPHPPHSQLEETHNQ